MTREDPAGVENAIRLTAIVFIAAAGTSESERLHKASLGVLSVLLVTFILLGSFTLQNV